MVTKMNCSGLYMVDEKTKNEIRQRFNHTEETIKRDVEIIKEWIKQQPHLPQGVQDDAFIENCLVRCKFRIEETKCKIEKYYTLRGIHSDTFKDVEIIPPSKHSEIVFGLPYLTDALERIVIIKVNPKMATENVDVMKFLKYAMCVSEYSLRAEYTIGHRIIQDFSGFTFSHFRKYAAKFSVYANMYQEAYFSRVAGIEYINSPPFVDIFMQGCRTMMSPKVFKRISIHKDLESLHKNIKKEYLPKDYGGDKLSIDEYLDMWDKEFAANITNFDKIIAEEVSMENLRIGEVKFNEVFGTTGTFKALNLD